MSLGKFLDPEPRFSAGFLILAQAAAPAPQTRNFLEFPFSPPTCAFHQPVQRYLPVSTSPSPPPHHCPGDLLPPGPATASGCVPCASPLLPTHHCSGQPELETQATSPEDTVMEAVKQNQSPSAEMPPSAGQSWKATRGGSRVLEEWRGKGEGHPRQKDLHEQSLER